MIDPHSPVARLCAEGMALEGTPAEAMRRFEAAWSARTDDYDAAIAAHFLARHQATPNVRFMLVQQVGDECLARISGKPFRRV